MGRVLVVGSMVVDLTFYTARIPAPGETVTGRFAQNLGGKGFNQAVASRKAGAPTAFIAARGPMEGDSFGPLFAHRLAELGIEASLHSIPDRATGAAAISVDARGANNIIVSLGANEALAPAHLDAAASLFEDVAVLLLQLETSFAAVEHALALVRRRSPRALTILNPAPARAGIPPRLLAQVDLLTPNETELAALCGRPIGGDEDLSRACAAIEGPRAILATVGERGSYFHPRRDWPEDARRFPAFAVEAVNTTGAGDAFNGALASGWARTGGDLAESVRLASAAAALSVTRPGTSAAMPAREEIDAFLASRR